MSELQESDIFLRIFFLFRSWLDKLVRVPILYELLEAIFLYESVILTEIHQKHGVADKAL
jgi:hypothetical protein